MRRYSPRETKNSAYRNGFAKDLDVGDLDVGYVAASVADFENWCKQLGIDINKEHREFLLGMKSESIDAYLTGARAFIDDAVFDMTRTYQRRGISTVSDDGSVRIGYVTFGFDGVFFHPYRIFDIDEKMKNLEPRERQIAKELTGVGLSLDEKEWRRIELKDAREAEFLRRQLLDRIRDGGIQIDEETAQKISDAQLPSELRLMTEILDLGGPDNVRINLDGKGKINLKFRL